MPPAISVAMIVRNESAQLEACLSGLAAVADEICVVDTGSDDDSLDIARRFGCKTAEFTWCDDFAAARNASLDLCTGDWALVVDADERIAPADAPRLRALTRVPPKCCYRFITCNYTDAIQTAGFVPCAVNDPWALGFAGWHPSGKVRLFPNGAGARFEGRLHELVNRSLEQRGFKVLTADICIHHYPLLRTNEQLLRKQALYAAMALAKCRERPDDAQACAELGAQYAEMGEYRQAAAAYRDAVRLAPGNAGHLREFGAMLHLLGQYSDARQVLELALRLDPDAAEGWRNLGVAQAACGAWTEALACFQRAAALSPGDSETHRSRAVALENLGRLAEAVPAAREALRLNPHSVLARELFERQQAAIEQVIKTEGPPADLP